jgi:beta-phosphoglucomutase-like phosphatase (HAD superfamily)
MLKGLIFDVEGTLVDTQAHGHRVAYNDAFCAANLRWQWDHALYAELLKFPDGPERLLNFMHSNDALSGIPDSAAQRELLAEALYREKCRRYQGWLRDGGFVARPGTLRIVRESVMCGLKLGVVTDAPTDQAQMMVADLFSGSKNYQPFDVMVCAEQAPSVKPDPTAYLIACEQMECLPREVVALEDSPGGHHAARAAGITTIVAPSHYYRATESEFSGAGLIVKNLDSLSGTAYGPAMTVGVSALQDVLEQAPEPVKKSRSNQRSKQASSMSAFT